MKKALTLALAFVMLLSMSVGVAAAGPTVSNGTQTVDATYVPGSVSSTGTVYFVQLDWTSLNNLVYSEGSTTYRWDGDNYVVDSSSAAAWSGGGFVATITNKSNADITATASYVDNGQDSLTTEMEWTQQSVTCESAAKNIVNYAGTGTPTTGTLSGTVKVTAGSISANTAGVGTISITLG